MTSNTEAPLLFNILGLLYEFSTQTLSREGTSSRKRKCASLNVGTRTSTPPPGMARKPPGRPVRGQLTTARSAPDEREIARAPRRRTTLGRSETRPSAESKRAPKSPPATHRLKRRPPRLSPTNCSRSLTEIADHQRRLAAAGSQSTKLKVRLKKSRSIVANYSIAKVRHDFGKYRSQTSEVRRCKRTD